MKTPEERGPLGAWAYDARLSVNLSPEEVVHLLGKYDPATIRKAESDGRRNMSRPLWRSLVPLYQDHAKARGLALPTPPTFGEAAPAAGDQAELVAALNRMAESNEKLIDMIGRVFLTLDERADSRTSFVRDALVELRTAVERASKGTGRGDRGPQKAAAKGSRQTRGSLLPPPGEPRTGYAEVPPRPTEVSRGPGE